MRFLSDNTASICPEMLEAISAANHGLAVAYGDDPWTERLDTALGEFFGTDVRAFVVTTGTAANSLALATLTPPRLEHTCAAKTALSQNEIATPSRIRASAAASPHLKSEILAVSKQATRPTRGAIATVPG